MSPGTVIFYSFSLFINPLNVEFGWDRAQISLATTIFTIGILFACPLIGLLVDRFGPRKIIPPSLLLLGLGLITLAFIETLWQFYLVFAYLGFICVGANSLAYIRLLATWFDRRRGLVIGLASSGMGVGLIAIPPFAHYMMRIGGWQAAYAGLGVMIIAIGIPAMVLIVRDTPQQMGLTPDGINQVVPRDQPPLIGYSMKETLRMRQFWMLLIIFISIAGAINSVAAHLVPMVQDRGFTVETAIFAASLFGGAMMLGRLITGYLLDKFFAPHVAAVFFLASTLAITALATGVPGIFMIIACVLVGLCAGAEHDVCGYLISRYFGLLSFGKIYGYTFSVYMIGVSIFPYLMGLGFELTGSYGLISLQSLLGFELTGSYTMTLSLCAVLNLISTIVLLFLGPYSKWEESIHESAAQR